MGLYGYRSASYGLLVVLLRVVGYRRGRRPYVGVGVLNEESTGELSGKNKIISPPIFIIIIYLNIKDVKQGDSVQHPDSLTFSQNV